MVWGDVKGYVGQENNTFKTNDVKDLIIKGFKTITPEKWTNFCHHVENKIESQYWTIMMIHYYITDCGAFKVHANYPFPLCA
jgi:hypothetical protein